MHEQYVRVTVAPVRARVRHVRECTPGAVRACVCARAIVFQGALRKTRRNSAHIHLAQSERTKMRPKKHATWKWIDEEVMGEREKADWVSMAREQTVELKLGTAQSMRASMPTGNQTPRRSLPGERYTSAPHAQHEGAQHGDAQQGHALWGGRHPARCGMGVRGP